MVRPVSGPRSVAARLAAWLCLGTGLSLAVAASAQADTSALGVPVAWTWALTAIQVGSLWAAGSGRSWGWMLGSAVQPT